MKSTASNGVPERTTMLTKTGPAPGAIIGKSAAIRHVIDLIKLLQYGDANVLITGESGVGKELVAQHIHSLSNRADGPLVPINCGALPAALFESELFGYERGAFTGATNTHSGLIELASGGTLFLDEICEMAPDLQVKLLRILQDFQVRRLGGKRLIKVNFRLISATNCDITAALESADLREDLYFRIAAFQIHVPPLRERVEDIPLLANKFLACLEEKYQRGISGFHETALQKMAEYRWPGNVRQLQNIVEQAYYTAPPALIMADNLTFDSFHKKREGEIVTDYRRPFKEAKERMIAEFEKTYLAYHLDNNDWNITQTAEACGIDRRTIHRFINKYDLKS